HALALSGMLQDEVIDLAVRGLTANKAVLRLNRAIALRSESLRKITTLADVYGLSNKGDGVCAGSVNTLRDRETAEWTSAVIVERKKADVAIPGLRHELTNGSA